MRRVVDECGLEPSDALNSLSVEASEEHRKRFFAVLTGFGDYKPEELAGPVGGRQQKGQQAQRPQRQKASHGLKTRN